MSKNFRNETVTTNVERNIIFLDLEITERNYRKTNLACSFILRFIAHFVEFSAALCKTLELGVKMSKPLLQLKTNPHLCLKYYTAKPL